MADGIRAIAPGENGRARIPGKNRVPGWDRDGDNDVFIQVPPGFAAYDKPLPTNLPKTIKKNNTDYNITWFNNFGVGVAGTGTAVTEKKDVDTYEVFLKKLPEGKSLCYYDPGRGSVQEITPQRVDDNTVKISLAIGDPPMGTFP